METAVVDKIVRYQKYLEKCMNDDKANAKHVSGNVRSHYTLLTLYRIVLPFGTRRFKIKF